MLKTFLVTGGCGFIGSHFVRSVLQKGHKVINLDALTYAASVDILENVNLNYTFVHGDIQNKRLLDNLLRQYHPQYVVNFAAETHVDRSIDSPKTFIDTNINGVFSLLESIRAYVTQEDRQDFRFLHISTDEVFGSADPTRPFTEQSPYNPSSPYAASKAAADHLVRSYYKTYDLDVMITNCTNNYGPYQFPEKLIPHMIICALQEKALPLYGDGMQMRDWLYVEDHVRGIIKVLEGGCTGQSYNIAALNTPIPNKDVVLEICDILDELQPRANGQPYKNLITFVQDRPGHDVCYALDASKIEQTLEWLPSVSFKEGLKKTVLWYLTNENWWANILDKGYQTSRLGLGEVPKVA
jgi:dTDP-glucose 4,6-dehydratase